MSGGLHPVFNVIKVVQSRPLAYKPPVSQVLCGPILFSFISHKLNIAGLTRFTVNLEAMMPAWRKVNIWGLKQRCFMSAYPVWQQHLISIPKPRGDVHPYEKRDTFRRHSPMLLHLENKWLLIFLSDLCHWLVFCNNWSGNRTVILSNKHEATRHIWYNDVKLLD